MFLRGQVIKSTAGRDKGYLMAVVSADETMLFYLTTEHLIKEHNCRKFYCITN